MGMNPTMTPMIGQPNQYQNQAPWMSNTIQGIPSSAGPTPINYSYPPHQMNMPGGHVPYSTVSFNIRPYEIANVLQPMMDSFKQPDPTSTSNAGQDVPSDTVYSDPASENRNRYARAKDQQSRHAQRRERHEQEDRERQMIHLSDLETSDSTRMSIDRKATVSYTHLRAHETRHDLVCRLLLEKKK